MNTLKEMVSDKKIAKFVFYKKENIWYETECGFQFPVPVEDVGDGIFMASESAITLMRYIRKHLNYVAEGRQDHD